MRPIGCTPGGDHFSPAGQIEYPNLAFQLATPTIDVGLSIIASDTTVLSIDIHFSIRMISTKTEVWMFDSTTAIASVRIPEKSTLLWGPFTNVAWDWSQKQTQSQHISIYTRLALRIQSSTAVGDQLHLIYDRLLSQVLNFDNYKDKKLMVNVSAKISKVDIDYEYNFADSSLGTDG